VRNRTIGFLEERSHTVVPVSSCAALTPGLNTFIPEANARLASTTIAARIDEVRAIDGPPVLATAGPLRMGEGPARVTVNGVIFDLHPEAFFQSNRYLLDALLRHVIQSTAGASRVLDLFCGSGFFTIPLSRAADSVVGIEADPVAVAQARLNAALNQADRVRFRCARVTGGVRTQSLQPDLVILNPPRGGCGRRVAERIAELRAERVVYVSCNPSTFAREAAVLLKRGYVLTRLTMVDQFPNTYHIELIAELELGS
jgi:tRNA/tmRNA/rRNA uracil-C5-methylase (TrmA/RlmC/RlmD family)